ncbi:relaxase/mobilization nuclease-like protein [Arcticibacter pallidicorallinus]|uniref:Relaxase/mobilization nuclease-like protein n=1 Tax=Arcticibacter pallidicorallinus TaxID=1259464 RepID=A0A2T0U3Y5_9SPHI|nr:relaxase/mobilization nuclease domain-containing protein [Arcticibacter pallidicorallinus]PRY52627.1 relaxase/mobilization nuclease-like protein [Arcticibacter pallidicorallinus]
MIAIQKVHSFKTAFDYNHKKTELLDPKEQAEVLAHNFLKYDRSDIMADVELLRQLKPNVKNDGYHVALSFAKEDVLDNKRIVSIAKDYMQGMGFDPDANYFALWRHNDGEDHEHVHVHLLLTRIGFNEGKAIVVSDSNNYKHSEALCRRIEQKYGLAVVRSSDEAQDRAPNKDELEMVQRTGKPSDRMLMQEKVKLALNQSDSVASFIRKCQELGVYLLFNQSTTTDRISGITYVMDNGFMAKGQKLGNMYKWNNISNRIQYEQSTDSKAIYEANSRTRVRFADLLSKGDERHQKRDDGSWERTKDHHAESTDYSRGDQRIERNGDEPEPSGNTSGTFGNEERISEDEKANRDQFLDVAGAAISNISGFVGGASAYDIDDDELKRKRRRKR